MKIGIFDSGIGGLTVLKSLIENHPNHQYYYFGDTFNMPYGEKTKKQLLEYSNNIIKFLLTKNVDMIIIACGTISSNIYNEIKNKYNVNIIDIVSPTIEYINNSNYKKIGVIATTMTIKSNIYNNIKVPVISNACPMFAPYIEGVLKDSNIENYLEEYLNIFKNKNIEALILGCTHYPLIDFKIKQFLGEDIDLIDLGEVISKKIELTNEDKHKIELYFSKVDNNLNKNVQNIVGDYKIIEKRL